MQESFEYESRNNNVNNVEIIISPEYRLILEAYDDNIVHNYHVLLDSGANCGIFNNINLLTDIQESIYTATINGIGGCLTTNLRGVYNGDRKVFYHPDAIANILSQSEEKDNGAHIVYDNNNDSYTVTYPKSSRVLVFERVGGLYCYDASVSPSPVPNYSLSFKTVKENIKKYTKAQVKRANKAVEVRRRLAYPSDETIPRMQSINNLPISRKDITRAVDIYGPDRNAIRGKTITKPSERIFIESHWKPNDIEQYLNVDLLFIDGEGYLLSVLSPIDYAQVTRLKNRKTVTLRSALLYQLATIDEQQYTVTHILSDNEGGISALYPELQRAGYIINPAGPGEHVPVVERKIRTLKERVRSYLQSLPYVLMFSLLRYLVEYCITMINLAPNNQREDSTSPYELFTGKKVDYQKQLRISFGDYAECKNPNRKPINNMKPRTDPCIALLPTLNEQGTYIFFDLRSRRIVRRDKWTELPFPEDIINRCNKLAANQGKRLRVNPFFSRGDALDERNIPIEHLDDVELFDHTNSVDTSDDETDVSNHSHAIADASDVNSDDSDGEHDPENTHINGPHLDLQHDRIQSEQPVEITEEELENERIRNEIIADREEQLNMQNPLNELDANSPDDLYAESRVDPITPHRYSTRSRGDALPYGPYKDGKKWVNITLESNRFQRAFFHATLTMQHKDKFGVYSNMTVKESIEKYGDPAKQSVINELKQLIRLQVFKFHDPNTLTPEQLRARIPSKTFVKIKYHPDGTFNKIKSRTVAGGHRQNRMLYSESDTSSPTISLVGLFILATIAANERRSVITMDIGGAYLRAYMKKFVLILINKEESEMLVDLYPELAGYRDSKGRLTAQALKAIYGCIESGKLWYDTLSAKLIANGYIQNPYDKCIFNKWHEIEGVQSTIGIHVDDCFISCAIPQVCESIVEWFGDEFEDVTITRGSVHQYTGMTLDFSHPNKLYVTMGHHIKELIENNKITAKAVSPSTSDLFRIDEQSPVLSEDKRDKFHSIVATASYIAKRIKPECLVVTSMLASRVHCSTEQDWDKLQRLLAYINATQDLPLCLEMSEGPVQVVANIDSSHATHGDYRGHTGVYITLGKGAIQAISVKQSINTKSSSETELVAVSDGATPAIYVQNIVQSQGLQCNPLIIEQDNQSTLAMITRGVAMGPTSRHINIRYFWIKDRIDSGDVYTRYVPTEDMTSDILTKPIQGALFYKLRGMLLNLSDYEMSN